MLVRPIRIQSRTRSNTEFTPVPEHASPLVSARARADSRTSRLSRSPRPARPGVYRATLSGPAAILAAAALWGTTGTASTLAPAGAPPAAVGAAGLAAGGLLLLLTSRGARPMLSACTRAQRWLLGLGALAVAGYPATFYPAVARTGVAASGRLHDVPCLPALRARPAQHASTGSHHAHAGRARRGHTSRRGRAWRAAARAVLVRAGGARRGAGLSHRPPARPSAAR